MAASACTTNGHVLRRASAGASATATDGGTARVRRHSTATGNTTNVATPSAYKATSHRLSRYGHVHPSSSPERRWSRRDKGNGERHRPGRKGESHEAHPT